MEQESKVVAKLRELGVEIDNTWDLVNMPTSPYVHAIPTLIGFLDDESLSYSELEGIVRSLLVKAARFKFNEQIFRVMDRITDERGHSLGWICGNAIYESPRIQDFERIYNIAQNEQLDTARQFFIKALGRLKDMRAESLLIELLDQEGVQHFAISALGMLKSKKAKDKIENFLIHRNKFFQRQAFTALKRIVPNYVRPEHLMPPKIKLQRVTIGGIVKIEIEKSYFVYAQSISIFTFVVFDYLTNVDLPNLKELLNKPILMVINEYGGAVKDGYWLKVGKIPLITNFVNLPKMYLLNVGGEYRIVDLKNDTCTLTTKEECEHLELLEYYIRRDAEKKIRHVYAERAKQNM